jgi:hypothetical protein
MPLASTNISFPKMCCHCYAHSLYYFPSLTIDLQLTSSPPQHPPLRSSPRPEHLFSTPAFSVSSLQRAKAALNSQKDRLDTLDLRTWEKHAAQVNRAGAVVPHLRTKSAAAPEMCTIAWAKMYEICETMQVLPPEKETEGKSL